MKKTLKSAVLLLFLIIYIVDCANKESSQLERENIQLLEELNRLKEENSNLINKVQLIANEKNEITKEMNLLIEQKEESEHKFNQLLIDNKSFVSNKSYFYRDTYTFDPYTVKIGEKILGLEISSITIIRKDPFDWYFVEFNGDFELSGVIMNIEQAHSRYTFMVDKEDIEKVPQIKKSPQLYIDISNEDEIARIFGKELKELEDTVHIKAKFNNYNHAYVEGSEWPNNITFVELIEKYD